MFFSASFVSTLALFSVAINGALVRVPDFGANPSKLEMNIYVPSKVATKPAIILAVRDHTIQQKDIL